MLDSKRNTQLKGHPRRPDSIRPLDMTQPLALAASNEQSKAISNTLQPASPPVSVPALNVPFLGTDLSRGTKTCLAQTISGSENHGSIHLATPNLDSDTGYLPKTAGPQFGTRGQSAKVADMDGSRLSLRKFLQAVATERIRSMPHKASNWDRTLRQIEEFALKVSAFADQCTPPAVSKNSSEIIYAHCLSLLQSGPSGAGLPESALLQLSNISQGTSLIVRNHAALDGAPAIKESLAQILLYVSDFTANLVLSCRDSTKPTQHQSKRTGINPTLRKCIDTFNIGKDQAIQQLWTLNVHDADAQAPPGNSAAEIRQWLEPRDQVIQARYSDVLSSRNARVEFTCEWFSQSLLEFIQSSDKAFWIEGPEGCGKSVLYQWTVETLQRPAANQAYNVIAYAADPLFPTEINVSSLVKGVLLQIFDQNISRPGIFEAFSNLLQVVRDTSSQSEIEDALMEALKSSLPHIAQPSMIIIDGFNHLDCGHDKASDLVAEIFDMLSGADSARLIAFSRPLQFLPETLLHRLNIHASLVHDDISRVVENFSPPAPGGLRRLITNRAQGSFLWATLTLQYLAAQGFSDKSLVSSKILPGSLGVVVRGLEGAVDQSQKIAQIILSTSAIALRPLLIQEIEGLLRANFSNDSPDQQTPDVQAVIEGDCGTVLAVLEDLVIFRFPFFRDAWLPSSYKNSAPILSNMHTDIANRLLSYLTAIGEDRSELNFQPVASQVIEKSIQSQPLLGYALEYWITHFTRAAIDDSSMFDAESNFVLPDSPQLANMQVTYLVAKPANEFLTTVPIFIQACRDILGDHQAVLQAIVSYAEALQTATKFTEAASNFGIAFQIAQRILRQFHPFTVDCVSEFFKALNDIADKDSDSFASTKSQMLQYMIAFHEQQSGPSSSQAIQFNQLLGQHYAETSQNELSVQVHRRMHSLHVDRHGKSSPQAKAAAKDIMTVLQGTDQQPNDLLDDDAVFDDIAGSYEPTDDRRIQASIAKAESLGSRPDLMDAELMYVSLLHSIACQKQKSQQKDESELKVGVHYAKFLLARDRTAEAQSVLLSLWSPFESSQDPSQLTTDLRLEVAAQMCEASLPTLALTVLNSVASKTIEDATKGNVPEDAETAQNEEKKPEKLFLDASRALFSVAESEPLLPKPAETSLLRILEEKLALGTSTIDRSTIELSQKLVASFSSEHRWQDLIELVSKTLRVSWPSLFQDPAATSDSQTADQIDPAYREMALTLADAYEKAKQGDDAASVYRAVFRETNRSGEELAPLTGRAFQAALAIYEKKNEVDQIVGIHQEALDSRVARYGEKSEQTAESVYTLASLCVQFGMTKDAIDYYSRIADTFSSADFHDQIALPALQALLTSYRSQQDVKELEIVYRKLWLTFLNKGSEYGISSADAKKLYAEYAQLLRYQLLVNPDLLRSVAAQYHRGCTSAFGENDPATLEAASTLADVLDRDCDNEPEAAKLHESILDKLSDMPNPVDALNPIAIRAEDYLTDYYRKRADADMDEQTLARAAHLQKKRYRRDTRTSGHLATTSLSSLAIWVSFLRRQDTQQSKHTISHELRHALNAVVRSHAEPARLYSAAIALASSYRQCGHTEEGLKTVQELHQRTILYGLNPSDRSDQQADQILARSSLVFLTAFEARLLDAMTDLADFHSKAIAETILWQNYQTLSISGATPELALTCGARLRSLLLSHDSPNQSEFLEQKLFDKFMETYSTAFKGTNETIRSFLKVLLDDIGGERLEVDISRSACFSLNQKVKELLRLGQYSSAIDISLPGFQFLRHVKAYENGQYMMAGFKLSLMLANERAEQAPTVTQNSQLLDISREVLEEALKSCRLQGFELKSLDVRFLSKVASLLGLQKSFEDLEWLLTQLWLGRQDLQGSNEDVMLTLGQRLVEARFAHGHIDSAIDLAEDILYNIRRVYGGSHRSVIEMSSLLSSMQMATGSQDATASCKNQGTFSALGQGHSNLSATDSEDTPQPLKIVKANLDHLLRVYKNDGADGTPGSQYVDAIQDLSDRLGQVSDARCTEFSRDGTAGAWGFVNGDDGDSGDESDGSP